MNALWFAFIIYILGMAVVLYCQPSLMFDGGAWKEFGLARTKNHTTIFPFWMFVILWSITSYVAGTLCVIGASAVSLANDASPQVNTTFTEEPAISIPPIDIPDPLNGKEPEEAPADARRHQDPHAHGAPKRRRRPKKRLPGYYVKGLVNGTPTYVYYGKQSPFDE